MEAKPVETTEAKGIKSGAIRFDTDLLFVAHEAARNLVRAIMT